MLVLSFKKNFRLVEIFINKSREQQQQIRATLN